MEALNVLLVDDQPAKLLTYEAMLAGIGTNLIKAATAREALALLLRTEIALVLMDVNMPELDGFELAAMIRQHPRCQRTAIIFVSAIHLSDVDRLRGYETGAVDYVSVPVVPEILRAKVGVFLDLYRKSTELEQLNATLEERVSARTAELERSVAQLRDSEHHLRLQREALEEANRRKNQFLAMLAHELRNPLQPILTAMELGRQPEIAPTDMEWSRNVIERQFKLLVRLVDDLLDASRINSGKLALRRENIALAEVVAAAVDSVRPSADAKHQTLEVEVPKEPVELHADGARLTQVFFNLLGNAVKFTPQGGHIALTVTRDTDDVEIRVRDNGAGIPSTQLPRIFDMFFQGDGRPGSGPGGLGLGLALVKQLVELHGGCVSARSAGPGAGSEFCARLPVKARNSDAISAVAEKHAELPRGPTRRILVVDDNRDAAESLALMLRLLGNEVEVLFDGSEAEATVVRFQPDVVLMDLGMPQLDGYQAARAIRRRAPDKRVMLIAITGWGGESDRRMSSEAGFDRHLVKPVQPTELLAVLSSLDQVAST